MQHLSARVVVVIFAIGLLIQSIWPMAANSRKHVDDIAIGGCDPQSGACGQFFFQLDGDGQVQFVNGYASTPDWQATAWWSPSGGWQFGDVIFSDPDLASLGARMLPFGSAFIGDPDPTSPDYPTGPPVPGQPVVSCQQCIDGWRQDCHNVAVATGAGAVAGAGTFISTCLPPAVPGAPVTLGGSVGVCLVGALGILGTGVWLAKRVEKQCRAQAPISCTDPDSGKPCYQLGYQ
jgi:hypothetical protein